MKTVVLLVVPKIDDDPEIYAFEHWVAALKYKKDFTHQGYIVEIEVKS